MELSSSQRKRSQNTLPIYELLPFPKKWAAFSENWSLHEVGFRCIGLFAKTIPKSDIFCRIPSKLLCCCAEEKSRR